MQELAVRADAAGLDVLGFMTFPSQHCAKLHSTSPLERLNGEIKHRTEVGGIFPFQAAITRCRSRPAEARTTNTSSRASAA